MSAQAIVDRILSDARQYARQVTEEAERQAAAVLAAAREEERRLREEQTRVRMLAQRENEARLEAVSASETRFALLSVKQEAAEAVFGKSVEQLSRLDRETALSFWGKLLEKYGEEGEEVVLSVNEKTLDGEFVRTVSERCGKNFRLSSAAGKFSGGMILRGPYCDKNLTAEMLVREFRERAEGEVCRILFPGEA